MMWTDGAGPTQPWGRIRKLMSSEFTGMTSNWNGNWGGYANPDADDLIKAIPGETDAAKLKECYTEAGQDLPDRRAVLHPDVPPAVVPYRQRECLDQLPARRMMAPIRPFRRWI